MVWLEENFKPKIFPNSDKEIKGSMKVFNIDNNMKNELLNLYKALSLFDEVPGVLNSLKVRKIKLGDLASIEPFSIESNYKIVFKLLGVGLLFLSLALISGLSMQSIFTANLIFKAIFTFIAWLIFVVTVLGVKYFNFPIKYGTRSLFIAMWAVLGAYFMNSYIIGS